MSISHVVTKLLRNCFPMIAVAMLIGCGGGGSSAPNPTPMPPMPMPDPMVIPEEEEPEIEEPEIEEPEIEEPEIEEPEIEEPEIEEPEIEEPEIEEPEIEEPEIEEPEIEEPEIEEPEIEEPEIEEPEIEEPEIEEPEIEEPEVEEPREWTGAPGINLIPDTAVVTTPATMLSYFVIAEYDALLGTEQHLNGVEYVACISYITETDCVDEKPFTTFFGGDALSTGVGGQNTYFTEKINGVGTVRLVSSSIHPSNTLAARSTEKLDDGVAEDQRIGFIVSAGNNGWFGIYGDVPVSFNSSCENEYGTLGCFEDANGNILRVGPQDIKAVRNLIANSEAERLFVVAGYTIDANGEYQRHSDSNGCAFRGIDCIYAPYVILDLYAGTSFSAPYLAAAIASILAVFPQSPTSSLFQLTKLCAVPEEGLDGYGRVDFTCLTISDGSGGWTLRGSSVSSLISALTPGQQNGLVVPGNVELRVEFFRTDGTGSVFLARMLPGTFGLAYSPDSGSAFDMPSGDGFSHMFADLGDGVSLGTHYSRKGFFIAPSYTEKPDFFGITDGYDDVESFGLCLGHRNLYVCANRQEAEGPLIRSADGTSISATVEKHFRLKNVGLNIFIEGDCFLGGSADTVFGKFKIQDGGCNQREEIDIDFPLTPKTSIELGLGEDQLASGRDVSRVSLGATFNPSKEKSFSLSSSCVSDNFGMDTACTTDASLKASW